MCVQDDRDNDGYVDNNVIMLMMVVMMMMTIMIILISMVIMLKTKVDIDGNYVDTYICYLDDIIMYEIIYIHQTLNNICGRLISGCSSSRQHEFDVRCRRCALHGISRITFEERSLSSVV